jgi:hypothetical protein
VEKKYYYSSKGPSIAHVFGDAYSDDFAFLYSFYIFGKKKYKNFYAKGIQVEIFFFPAVTLKSSVLWDVTPCVCRSTKFLQNIGKLLSGYTT